MSLRVTMKRWGPARDPRGRGMAVAVVLSILLVMSLAVALGQSLLAARMRSVGTYRTTARALYCAEAGLAAGRSFAQSNANQWAEFLRCNDGTGPCPAGYPLTGSAATDGSASYEVRIFDNHDEIPPAADNPYADSDLTVVVVSRCTEADLPARVLQEYVSLDPSLITDYRAQAGLGRGHQGNQN